MKKLIIHSIAIFFTFVAFINTANAQGDENRTKVQMTIEYGGKLIITDLNSISTSLTRGYEEQPLTPAVKDTAKSKMPHYPGTFYLSMDAKKISDDLLKLFAKKQTHFDGTITIVDSYGKNPNRTIKFKQASLYSYSDQISAISYADSYSAYAISFNCLEISINGITIEQ